MPAALTRKLLYCEITAENRAYQLPIRHMFLSVPSAEAHLSREHASS